jgi:FkbM family methyltransferase
MFLPTVKALRRYLLALQAVVGPARASYSQNGEDLWLASRIPPSKVADEIYIDVGANHPTLISNTYLFYRRGGKGIIIEPNRAFRPLYRLFRKRDVLLTVGCGRSPSVAKFFANRYTVLSGFIEDKSLSDGSFEYVPIITLESLRVATGGKPIFLLSIDVEGLNYEVLQGAGALLRDTEWVVIEFGDHTAEITDFMNQHSFTLAHRTTHNLLFQRNNLPGSGAFVSA